MQVTITLEVVLEEDTKTLQVDQLYNTVNWFETLNNLPDVPGRIVLKQVTLPDGEEIVY